MNLEANVVIKCSWSMIFLVFITVLASKIQSIFVMIFMMDTNLSPSYTHTPYKTTVACNPTQAVN